jgi:hypothetical protein
MSSANFSPHALASGALRIPKPLALSTHHPKNIQEVSTHAAKLFTSARVAGGVDNSGTARMNSIKTNLIFDLIGCAPFE